MSWNEEPLESIYEHDKDGAVWWFDQKAFECKVHESWRKYDMERYRDPCNGQINLNKTAFKNDGPPWITKLHYPFPFKRMEAQQGFFTIAGRLDTNHAELIGDLLQGDETGKYIIPKENKQEILKRLRIMGVLAQSLDYPGADLVGSELAEQLKTKN